MLPLLTAVFILFEAFLIWLKLFNSPGPLKDPVPWQPLAVAHLFWMIGDMSAVNFALTWLQFDGFGGTGVPGISPESLLQPIANAATKMINAAIMIFILIIFMPQSCMERRIMPIPKDRGVSHRKWETSWTEVQKNSGTDEQRNSGTVEQKIVKTQALRLSRSFYKVFLVHLFLCSAALLFYCSSVHLFLRSNGLTNQLATP